MTNGSDRLDRIERILEHTAKFRSEHGEDLAQVRGSLVDLNRSLAELRGSLVETRNSIAELRGSLAHGNSGLQRITARQQHRDEAFERHWKAINADAENIRVLVRIAESRNRRPEDPEDGESA